MSSADRGFNVFDATTGKVGVCAKMCSSCIYRPGTPIPEARDRVIAAAIESDNVVICHSTLDTKKQLVCHGFYRHEDTAILQIAKRLSVIEFLRLEDEDVPASS
jgi:hypothetical protein